MKSERDINVDNEDPTVDEKEITLIAELSKSRTYKLTNVLIARREDRYPTKEDTRKWVPWHNVCAQVILASSNKDPDSKNKDDYPGYYKLERKGANGMREVYEYGLVSHVQYTVDGELKIVHIKDYTTSNLKPVEGRALIDSLALKL